MNIATNQHEIQTHNRTAATQIAYHVEQIAQILHGDAPAGTVVQGFQFRLRDGEIMHDTIWASAINKDCRLYWLRPAFFEGWRDVSPKIAGEVA